MVNQLALHLDDPPHPTAHTSNSLFTRSWERWVRQGPVELGPGEPSIHVEEGFGVAITPTTGSPVRWSRPARINLMPEPTVRFEPGARISSTHLLGQVLMLVGILSSVLGGWYLWGTGILTAGDQARLSDQFEARILEYSDVTALPEEGDAATAARIETAVAWDDPGIDLSTGIPEPVVLPIPTEITSEPVPELGGAVGRIIIPTADIDWIIVEGVESAQLRSGPGHIPGTPLPGQIGNTVISGHRTTNGAPFYDLDLVERGDIIVIETLIGTHRYEVVGTTIVEPTDTWVASQWNGSWLTLTTCHPRYSSRQRLVVHARLIDGPNFDVIEAQFGDTDVLPGPSGA